MKVLYWMLVIGLLSTIVWPVSAQEEGDDGWTEPIQISVPNQSSWFPTGVAARSGRFMALWSTTLNLPSRGFDLVMESSTRDGQKWTPAVDIQALSQGSNLESEVTRPAVWIDERDIVHMTFRGLTTFSLFYSQAPLAEANDVRGWSAPVELGQVTYFSQVLTDRRGTIHVVFTANVYSARCPICYRLFYRRSPDNGRTWTDPVDISRVASGSAKPALLLDPDNGLHVAWESARGGTLGRVESPAQILIASSLNGGDTWSEPQALAAPGSEGSLRIGLALEPLGRILAVWTALPQGRMFYSMSSNRGRSWDAAVEIPGLEASLSSTLDNLSLATDGSNLVHLACVCGPTVRADEFDVSHLVWDGNVWSRPEVVTTYEGDLPEWPVIRVGLGNVLHLVWYVRNEEAVFDTDSGNYTIWYATRTTDSVAFDPAVEPTAVIRPTMPPPNAPTAILPPTATPIRPSFVSNPGEINQVRPYNEADYVLLVGLSLLPALLLIGAIGLVMRLRRG
jgi:hypothetical protein